MKGGTAVREVIIEAKERSFEDKDVVYNSTQRIPRVVVEVL